MRIKSAHLLGGVLVLGAGWLAVQSRGFLEADEITHLLKSRDAWQHPELFLDIWARPLCVALYALTAAMGRWSLILSRLVAVIVTALTGIGAWRLYLSYMDGRFMNPDQGPGLKGGEERPLMFGDAWVWGLFFAQPLVLLNSFTVMTEMQLACLWVWSVVFAVRGSWKWCGLLVGIGALARPEGLIALAIFPLIVVWKAWHESGSASAKLRYLFSLVPAFLPALLWWAGGAIVHRDILWMLHAFPWQVHSQYGTTGLIFLMSLLASGAVWMWVPLVVGMAVMFFRGGAAGRAIVAIIAGFFVLHAFLGILGLMGSMSLPRYFVAVAPYMSVAGVVGLNRILPADSRWANGKRGNWLRKAIMLVAILPAVALLMAEQLPTPASWVQQQMDAAISGFERRTPHDAWSTRLIAAHPYVYYRTGVSMESPSALRIFSDEAIKNAPPGTCVITDPIVWSREGHPDPDQLQRWGYRADMLTLNAISAIPPAFNLSTMGVIPARPIDVGLWVKQ